MRTLVIGGAGLLGTHLAKSLDAEDVAIVDNFSGSMQYRSLKNIRTFTANATDLNSLSHVFNVYKPEAIIISLAHYFSPDAIYKHFDDTRLILESINAISYLLNQNIQKVVFCSSQDVYNGYSKPVKETKRISHPISYHGAAKLAAEGVISHRCKSLGIPCITARIFDMYGPRIMFCPKTGVINFLIDSLLSYEMVGLSGPKRLRDFIHVEDVASAVLGLLRSDAEGVYNIGTGEGTTLREVAGELKEHIDVVYEPLELDDPFGKKASLVADISKLQEALPEWDPEHDIISDLKNLVKWRKNEVELYSNSPVQAARVLAAMRGLGSV